jgi:hypothetical protein
MPKSTASPNRKRKRSKNTVSLRSDPRLAAPTLFYRALSFASAADAYVRTYGNKSDLYMINFLLARAFELALKSALSANGVSPGLLASRKYGHNFAALMRECSARSIKIVDPAVPDSAWGLRNLNEAYSTKELEYQERGSIGVPTPTLLRELVHFALHQACALALRADVRARLLAKGADEPGLTLELLAQYAI